MVCQVSQNKYSQSLGLGSDLRLILHILSQEYIFLIYFNEDTDLFAFYVFVVDWQQPFEYAAQQKCENLFIFGISVGN